ncbi:MAG TPA: sensor histidine kinase, partial [Ilumatobacteraceae bacterium]|nr:sensor histidine kinase [Ilumatobacteraceae bacterium]
VTVTASADLLQQAVANLVANAIAHTPSGTPIEIEATAEGSDAIVRVSDRGPGLSPEALVHAFDRFWQADPARVGSGSGLGLSIVYGIVTGLGGTVTAANRAGRGATFEIRVPVAAG